jgi:MFS superfamily sulfate permease-like transporter
MRLTNRKNLLIKDEVKSFLFDLAGGFGDIGVFIPLALTLIVYKGFYPVSIFLCAGLFYIFSALYFKIPMPVQPLKAMAAITITSGISHNILRLAGLEFSIILLLMLIPGVLPFIERIVKKPIVRGIQFGLGLLLISTGMKLIGKGPLLAISAFFIIGAFYFTTDLIPPLLPVILAGFFIAFCAEKINIDVYSGFLSAIPLPLKGIDDLVYAFFTLVVPQIGLTLGNAIIATRQTAIDLFPSSSEKVTLKGITLSIATGNVISAVFGGIPMCHGSGGLTAHHRFGARGPRATVITGIAFIVVGLISSTGMMKGILGFPMPFLGVMLVIVGIFHAALAGDCLKDGISVLVVLLVGIVSVLFKNMTLGIVTGIVAERVMKFLFERRIKKPV